MDYYGSYTWLDTPINLDGVDYGLLLKVKPTQEQGVLGSCALAKDPESPTPITKKLVFERAVQQTSYTDAAREIIQNHLCGGNVVAPIDPERVYSWVANNPSRGNIASQLQIGDCIILNSRKYLVLDVRAYGEAPASVDWRAEDGDLLTDFYLDINDLYFPQITESGVSYYFDRDADGVFYDLGVQLGLSALYQTRTTYLGNDDYLPPDAALGLSYWVDPNSGRFRMGHEYADIVAASTVTARCAWRGVTQINTLDDVVVRGFGAGYSPAGDQLTLLTTVHLSQSDGELIYVRQGGSLHDWGKGFVEVRPVLEKDTDVLALEWSYGGAVTNIVRRASGVQTSPSFTAATFTSGEVRIIKSGSDIQFWVEDTLVYTESVPWDYFYVGVGSYGDNYIRVGFDEQRDRGLQQYWSTGELYQIVSIKHEDVVYRKNYELFYNSDLNKVKNKTTGEDMLDVSGINRNVYTYSNFGDLITFYSDSSGDTVRVFQEASESLAPGDAPRTFGLINGGTQGSFDVDENKLHWHDYAIIADVDDTFNAVEGDELSYSRDPVFDPNDPPDLYLDTKNGAGDWTLVDPSNYRLLPENGIFIISKPYLLALGIGVGTPLCARIHGTRFRQAGNMSIRHTKELEQAVDCLDEAWVSVGAGGGGSQLAGETLIGSPTATGYDCIDCGIYIADLEIGIARQDLATLYADFLRDQSASLPIWRDGTTYWTGSDLSAYTSDQIVTTDCPDPCTSSYSNGLTVAPDDFSIIYTNGFPGQSLSTSAFGTSLSYQGTNPTYLPSQCFFQTTGIGFDFAGLLGRLPDGVTILEAYAAAKYDGLLGYTWSVQQSYTVDRATGLTKTDKYSRIYVIVNGVVVREYEREDGGVVLVDTAADSEPNTSGSINFYLVGRRKDSRPIIDVFGQPQNSRSDTYGAVGGSISTSSLAEDGKWSLINITDAIQSLVDARNDEYSDFELWPSTGTGLGKDGSGLHNYLKALKPTQTLSTSVSGSPDFEIEVDYTANGKYFQYSSLSLGNIMVRFRMPTGALDEIQLPIIRSAL